MEWVCRKPETRFSLEILVVGVKASQEYRYGLTIQINGTKAEIFKEALTLLSHGKGEWPPKEKNLFVTRQEESTGRAIPTYFFTGTQGRGRRENLSRSHTILSQTETMNVCNEVKEGAKLVLSQLKNIFVFDPIPSHMRNYTSFSEKLLADGSNRDHP